jgi:hypothetical protein
MTTDLSLNASAAPAAETPGRRARAWQWLRTNRKTALFISTLFAAAIGISVYALDQTPYPLTVTKTAYNDAGVGGTVSGSPVTSFSATDLTNNKIVSYVINFGPSTGTDTSSLGALSFSDSLSSSMTQVGSPVVPSSWATSAGTNGVVSYSIPTLLAGSNASRSPVTPPILSTGSGGGDGYAPIIYTSTDGTVKRFFEIYHHQSNNASINCQNFTDGSACSGYPNPLVDSVSSQRMSTSMWVHDVQWGTKLYYPANYADKSMGLGCWDMSKNINCPYIPLANYVAGNATDTPSGNASVAGISQSPNKPNQVFMAQWGYLYCWDLSANAICNKTASFQYLTPSGHFDPTSTSGNGYGQGHTDLLVVGPASAPNSMIMALTNGWLTCIDISNWPAKTCTTTGNKWPLQVLGMSGHDHNILSHYLDTSGNVIGACATIDNGWGNKAPFTACYTTDGVKQTTPAILTTYNANYYYVSNSVAVGTRVYYPLPGFNDSLGGSGATACWDFKANAACVGFKDGGSNAADGLRRWVTYNQGSTTKGTVANTTNDYFYRLDGSCVFGLGDAAQLWSFDPVTGNAPCVVATDDVTVPDPKPFCDGADHYSNWNNIQINNPPSAIMSVAISIYDATTCPFPNLTNSCTVLATGDSTSSSAPATPKWNIPITPQISLKQHPSLRVQYTYKFVNNLAPTSYPGFSVTTMYSPDASGNIGQVCMRAKVNTCPASVIDNLAIVSSGTTGNVLGRGLWSITTPFANPSYTDTAYAVNQGTGNVGLIGYQSSYQVTDWSGDLTAYTTDSSTGLITTTSAWSDSSGNPASAAELLPAASARTILTTSGPGAVGTVKGLNFTQTALAANGSGVTGTQLATFGSNSTDQTNLINYLRGDRSLEASSSSNNPYRRRMLWDTTKKVTALGDIIHSAPVYSDTSPVSSPGTAAMVYVQSNDGMLHGFNANPTSSNPSTAAGVGVEVFAFIPQSVWSLLPATSNVSYVHNWIMDGQVAVSSTLINSKNILVGSSGGSNPVIYGLDVTGLPVLPKDPTKMVLFESTDASLGRANGTIIITNLPDTNSTPVALLGNGMGSSAGLAQLVQVNLSTGAITPISTGVGSTSSPNGLSAPTIVKDSTTGKLIAVYAGDMQGNMWRFPVTSSGIGSPTKLFTTQNSPLQPISSAPTVSDLITPQGKSGYFVFFGTGAPVDRTNYGYDPTTSAEQAVQSVYGVFEPYTSSSGFKAYGSPLTVSNLVAQTIDPTTGAQSSNTVDLTSVSGWYVNLQAGSVSGMTGAERVLNPPYYPTGSSKVNSITFLTAVPHKSNCVNADVPQSRGLLFNANSGGSVSTNSIVGTKGGVVNFIGTLGGFTTVKTTTVTEFFTSNATGTNQLNNPSLPQNSTSTIDSAANCNTNGCTFSEKSSINLKRTSWVQLY